MISPKLDSEIHLDAQTAFTQASYRNIKSYPTSIENNKTNKIIWISHTRVTLRYLLFNSQVASLSILFIQLLVVRQDYFEVLFAKILNFSLPEVFMRTSMSFVKLASFQTP